MDRITILNEAAKCVCGEREQDYGTPENNFTLIGKLWEAYTGQAYSAKDVAMMMALLKVARIKTGTKADSFVDLAGYAACAGEIADHEAKADKSNLNTKAKIPKSGDRFTYNGIEFVALGEEQGSILAVVSERLGDKMPFDKGNRNDWKGSTLREYLNDEYLQNFNRGDLIPFVSDLTADDGMTDYGTSEDYIAILSDNLYRKYRAVMPRYDTWVWSITP